ncbi:PP2C family protein-serine/threonine phosphatase [Granulosicoccus antarcticus]|uniref:Serine/threonine phosphatase stp n=1 Tax=Granulosicoccus antarcticus IMCC3135 TaxID=1192854 RepID=A0A2Z2P1F8_9GAMM|nr:protein phosphatase 2C domain-containing protein [Granulosicoccus antarcticus]ASJ74277.1 Serine/threonine phosphatase stp [Granulosicoccus antarcticus IMCC3135]
MKLALKLDAAGVTDVGQARKHNEDSLTVDSEANLYAIADGMGGHMSGEVASQSTLDELMSRIKIHAENIREPVRQEDYYNIVLDAVNACNELILAKNRNNGSNLGQGMGTTLVGAYFLQNKKQVVIFNVGDSRLYRLRGGDLQQLTRDHTMYQEWYDAGQKGTAPSKNILIKAIGLLENIFPDITLENVSEGDVFLLCSDGLSNLIDAKLLQKVLVQKIRHSPDMACNELISIANANGGNDNISVVIVKVDGTSATFNKTEDLDKTVQRRSV